MRTRPRALSRLLAAGLLLVALGPAGAIADEKSLPGAHSSTAQLDERQAVLDNGSAPALRRATAIGSAIRAASTDGGSAIDRYATAANPAAAGAAAGQPHDLRTSLLPEATSVDPDDVTFSWQNADTSAQTWYQISVYARAASAHVLYQSAWTPGTAQSSVTVPGLSAALADNQLYYWQVQVRHADGSTRTSEREPFVTAVGSGFESTSLSWTATSSVANLVRTEVTGGSGVEKAMLSVTALDTEAARRHVFDVVVNGTDLGVGPTRRAGSTLYYNTFDITSALHSGQNIVGLYNYSQAKSAGYLMQLTYFYADGSRQVVYNSATDRASTQILPLDSIMYGGSNASLGTKYYTDLAQNADTTRFPLGWQQTADYSANPWPHPVAAPTNSYTLAPSIVANATRRLVAPVSLTRAKDGTCTIAFRREITGDVQLTVKPAKTSSLVLMLGEELSHGKAMYRMRTGNVYRETWRFKGRATTRFSGFGLMSFRYLTIGGCPANLRLSDVSGIETTIASATTGSFTSDNTLINAIARLGSYSQSEATIDTVTDSATRERRPYEGDALIYQDLTYGVSDDYATVRNTWNYLLANPSQYTEYRLMSPIGVYEDYLQTGDVSYAGQVYGRLTQLLGAVTFNPRLGLVHATNTVDLVDWPRSELPGYDFARTYYKTVVNAVAYQAYLDMARLATALGRTADASTYQARATAIKTSLIRRLYDPAKHGFRDGLTASGRSIGHHSAQNDYVALAFGITTGQPMVDQLANRIAAAGRQTSGSIYSAYFMYRGLYDSHHADLATELLTKSQAGDVRTYASVLRNLRATMTPEAWSTASKPNMSFSHVWGSGGGNGIIDGVVGARPLTPGFGRYLQTIGSGSLGSASSSIPTIRGTISTSFVRSVGSLTVRTSVPAGTQAVIAIPGVSSTWRIQVDGARVSRPSFSRTGLQVSLAAGRHSIVATAPVAVRVKLAGRTLAPAMQGEAASWFTTGATLRAVVVTPVVAVLGSSGSVQCSTHAAKRWNAFGTCTSVHTAGRGSAVDGIRLRLRGAVAAHHSIRYRVFASGRGWQHWQRDAGTASVGRGESIKAVQVQLVAK